MDLIKKLELNKKQILPELYEWAETFDLELDELEQLFRILMVPIRMLISLRINKIFNIYLIFIYNINIKYFKNLNGQFIC